MSKNRHIILAKSYWMIIPMIAFGLLFINLFSCQLEKNDSPTSISNQDNNLIKIEAENFISKSDSVVKLTEDIQEYEMKYEGDAWTTYDIQIPVFRSISFCGQCQTSKRKYSLVVRRSYR